jgi:phage terminase small subunit
MAKSNKPKKKATKKKSVPKSIDELKATTIKVEVPEALKAGVITGYYETDGEALPNTPKGWNQFTDKERMLILNYTSNGFNKRRAAIDAGYSERSASEIAHETLNKPHIKAEIDRIVNEKMMSKEETIVRLSEMARGSLNDYLRVVLKATRPLVKVGLQTLIDGLKAKIEDQEKFIIRSGNMTDQRRKMFESNIEDWLDEILKYEIELERNPAAYREVEGPEVMEEVVELDLVKLMNDKERGIIKTFEPVKGGGHKIELYGADGALRDLGKYHGIFEKDKQPPPAVQVNIANFSSEELNALLALQKKAKK